MNTTRKLFVNTLATIAFVFLFLLPMIGLKVSNVNADQTAGSAVSYSDDYVFFVVQNDDVPLAAAPSQNISTYIFWISLCSFAAVVLFVYSTWYLSVRRNICELSGKLSPLERRKIRVSTGFFHPIRSYELAKEAEDSVASIYVNM